MNFSSAIWWIDGFVFAKKRIMKITETETMFLEWLRANYKSDFNTSSLSFGINSSSSEDDVPVEQVRKFCETANIPCYR